MSCRSCFQFTNIAGERTGRGSRSWSAPGSSVWRRRAGARAAAQSQVGGRRGGGAGARGGSGAPETRGSCGMWHLPGDGGSAPPVSVFPLCHGANIANSTWGRGLRIHLHFRARTGTGWGRRRPGRCCGTVPTTLAPGWWLTPSTLSWCPRPSSKLSGPQCCPGRDKSTLFVSLVPQRDD